MRKMYTPETAALDVETALRLVDGRWKLVTLFHLFDGKVQRYSDLERLIPRQLYPQVPPKVEYRLTEWGQSLCPALDALLPWLEQKPAAPAG